MSRFILRIMKYVGGLQKEHWVSTEDITFIRTRRLRNVLEIWTSESEQPAITLSPSPEVGDAYLIYTMEKGDNIDKWQLGPAVPAASEVEALTDELAAVEREQRECEQALAVVKAELHDVRAALSELDHAVHSGYDFNADPQNLTLHVGNALRSTWAAEAPRAIALAEGGKAIVSSFPGSGGGTRYLLTFTEPCSLMTADCHALAAALLSISNPAQA